jgi:hypothetical protein
MSDLPGTPRRDIDPSVIRDQLETDGSGYAPDGVSASNGKGAATGQSAPQMLYHLGLVLMDDVESLLHQMKKDLQPGDLGAYAYGLAGSRDPRGRVGLEQLRRNGSPQIRAIAGRALARW